MGPNWTGKSPLREGENHPLKGRGKAPPLPIGRGEFSPSKYPSCGTQPARGVKTPGGKISEGEFWRNLSWEKNSPGEENVAKTFNPTARN